MIFPKEILENTHPVFAKTRNRKSSIIYGSSLLFLTVGLSLLPIIETDIYFSAPGIIRSSEEKAKVISPKSGYVVKSKISFNEKVHKGDTLLIIDNRLLNDELKELRNRIGMNQTRISDLNYLLFANHPDQKHLKTPAFKTDLAQYSQKLQRIDLDVQTKRRTLKRQQILYDQKVISDAEFEKHRYNYQFTRQEKALLIQEKKARWDLERKTLMDELVTLNNKNTSLENSQHEYILTSKIDGTLFNNKEVINGSYLNQGEVLADISPDSELVAEVYIPTSKIGLLRAEQSINYQIDAFNARNWGIATGVILEISEEIEMINNTAVFKAIASINESHLALKNGTKGKLKKGLTLTSQFIISERTLFDLLYDKADDWINPKKQVQAAQK